MQTQHARARTVEGFGQMSIAANVVSAVASWWREQMVRSKARRTARMLESLSDRTLHDIGIDRSEIGPVARHCARHNRH
jgi:uncharacterized protein YjiS (DUF1127 family)